MSDKMISYTDEVQTHILDGTWQKSETVAKYLLNRRLMNYEFYAYKGELIDCINNTSSKTLLNAHIHAVNRALNALFGKNETNIQSEYVLECVIQLLQDERYNINKGDNLELNKIVYPISERCNDINKIRKTITKYLDNIINKLESTISK